MALPASARVAPVAVVRSTRRAGCWSAARSQFVVVASADTPTSNAINARPRPGLVAQALVGATLRARSMRPDRPRRRPAQLPASPPRSRRRRAPVVSCRLSGPPLDGSAAIPVDRAVPRLVVAVAEGDYERLSRGRDAGIRGGVARQRAAATVRGVDRSRFPRRRSRARCPGRRRGRRRRTELNRRRHDVPLPRRRGVGDVSGTSVPAARGEAGASLAAPASAGAADPSTPAARTATASARTGGPS